MARSYLGGQIIILIYSYTNQYIEAGCDEAGRGCLAGPVFAAAVILPPNFNHSLLNDSKQLSEKHRNELKSYIEEHALDYHVAQVEEQEIDQINILNASIKAMHLALDGLVKRPEFLLIDGNRFKPYAQIPHQCIIKGDAKYGAIAAASILAKTYRDQYMKNLAVRFPQYGWEQNKGYGTRAHRIALQENGPSDHHRRSFHVKNHIPLFE